MKRENNITFFLSGRIDHDRLVEFTAFLKDHANTADTVTIVIKSSGGCIADAIAFATIIQALPCPTITVNLSNIDSAANVVFVAGDIRLTSNTGVFFFHDVLKQLEGTYDERELRRFADEMHVDTERISTYLCERTGTDSKSWRQLMKSGVAIDAQEALRLNLVTKICDHEVLAIIKSIWTDVVENENQTA